MPLLGRHKSLQGGAASGSKSASAAGAGPAPAPLVCESPLFGVRRQLPVAERAGAQGPALAGRPLGASVSLTGVARRQAGEAPRAGRQRDGDHQQQRRRQQELADQLETLGSIPKQITRQQIHYAFSIMDANADGLIDLRDLSQTLANLGVPIDEAILSHVLTSSVSKRGDHLINESEFLEWIGNFIQVSDLLAPGGSGPAGAVGGRGGGARAGSPAARPTRPIARSSSSGAAGSALAAHSPEAQFAIEQQRRQRRGSGSGLALIRSLSSASGGAGSGAASGASPATAPEAPANSAAARTEQQLEQLQETRNDLRAAFCVFDLDGDGFITIDEVQQGLKLLGETWSQQELDQVFSRCEGAPAAGPSVAANKKATGRAATAAKQKAAADLRCQRISIDDFVRLLL